MATNYSTGLGKRNYGFQPDSLRVASSIPSSSLSLPTSSRCICLHGSHLTSSDDFQPETKYGATPSLNSLETSSHHAYDNSVPTISYPLPENFTYPKVEPGKKKQRNCTREFIVFIAVMVSVLFLVIVFGYIAVYFTVFNKGVKDEGRNLTPLSPSATTPPSEAKTSLSPSATTPPSEAKTSLSPSITTTPSEATTSLSPSITTPSEATTSLSPSITTTPSEATTTPHEDNMPVCGVGRQRGNGRIIGGTATERGAYPWLVMLFINGELNCGGSIIDAAHVITAAHCVENVPPSEAGDKLKVVAGAHLTNYFALKHVQNVSVRAYYKHTNYNIDTPAPESFLNDIAVLRLSQPLTFDSFVSPVCLPDASSTLPARCTVAGWGSTTAPRIYTYPDELREVTLWTYNSSQCNKTFNDRFLSYNDDISYYLTDGVMCAANSTHGGLDSCAGDSGGPLFCLEVDPHTNRERYTQFGIVSWGDGCAEPDSPGFYTYLPYFRTWLNSVAIPALAKV